MKQCRLFKYWGLAKNCRNHAVRELQYRRVIVQLAEYPRFFRRTGRCRCSDLASRLGTRAWICAAVGIGWIGSHLAVGRGGGPIAIGKTLHLQASGCRSKQQCNSAGIITVVGA